MHPKGKLTISFVAYGDHDDQERQQCVILYTYIYIYIYIYIIYIGIGDPFTVLVQVVCMFVRACFYPANEDKEKGIERERKE